MRGCMLASYFNLNNIYRLTGLFFRVSSVKDKDRTKRETQERTNENQKEIHLICYWYL